MTTIEYALIAGLAVATVIGVAAPLGRALTSTFGEVAAAFDRGRPCGGAFCVEPAAGDRAVAKVPKR